MNDFQMKQTQSEKVGELIRALAKAKLEYPSIHKTAENALFRNKYVTLEDILEATREPLAKNGLVIIPTFDVENGVTMMTVKLFHESDQFISSKVEIIPPPATISKSGNETTNELQRVGIAITYMQRYTIQALLGVSGEDDTDGNAATDKSSGNPSSKEIKDKLDEKKQPQDKVDPKLEKLIKQIHAVGAQKGYDHDGLKGVMTTYFKVESMKDLTATQLQKGIAKLNKLPDMEYKELVESIAKAIGFKYNDVLDYIQSLGKDWKWVQSESAKWVADDKSKEAFIGAISNFKMQPVE